MPGWQKLNEDGFFYPTLLNERDAVLGYHLDYPIGFDYNPILASRINKDELFSTIEALDALFKTEPLASLLKGSAFERISPKNFSLSTNSDAFNSNFILIQGN